MRHLLLLLFQLSFFLSLPASAQAQSDWHLIFSDEFDQPDGSRPDSTKWQSCPREGATWSRWISNHPDVTRIEDGALVCRAIPNPDTSRDRVPMLTGAVETRNHFSFTYGLVEIRLRVESFEGTFPAAWLMPQPPCEGWPYGGEIDIFETIDNQHTAYQTVHSHWTYHLHHGDRPQHSFRRDSIDVTQWHVYSLEWTPEALQYYIDGDYVGTYPRSSDSDALAGGQWPFTHPFYVILNQSVGDGTWAKPAVLTHTYATHFDYVRIFQR